jgi:hypothetical protein
MRHTSRVRLPKTSKGAVNDPRIGDKPLVHLHLPEIKLKAEGAEPVGPVCLEFSGAVLHNDESVRTFLRGLRSLSRLRGWRRLDEIAVEQAPEFRVHLDQSVRGALDSPDPRTLATLLVEWPLAYLQAEVAQRLADGACDRETAAALRGAGQAMARQRKSSPKERARRLRDAADHRRAEYLKKGEIHDLKCVLAEVDPAFATKERLSYNAYKQGSRTPQIWIYLVVCPQHAGAVGIRPAPPRRVV